MVYTHQNIAIKKKKKSNVKIVFTFVLHGLCLNILKPCDKTHEASHHIFSTAAHAASKGSIMYLPASTSCTVYDLKDSICEYHCD